MKKALVKSANIFWLCLAVLIILTAVFIQLGRLMAPFVENNQDYITRYVGERIASVVVAQSIDAHWNRLSPAISIRNLEVSPINTTVSVVSDASPPVSIAVDSIALELDLLQSIFQGRLVWKEISLSNAKVYLQQQVNGNWQLAGFEANPNRDNASAFIDDPVDIFLLAEKLQVSDVSLMLESYEGKILDLAVTDIEFQNQRDFHRMVVDIQVDNDSVAKAILEANGDPRSSGKRDVRGYIGFADFPVAKLKNFITNLNVDIDGLDSDRDRLNVNVWLSSQKRHFYEFNGDFGVTLTATDIQGIEIPSSVNTRFGGHFYSVPTDLNFNIQIQDSNLIWSEQKFQVDLLDISFQNAAWLIKAPRLHLPSIAQVSGFIAAEKPKLLDVIDSLNPQGDLINTEITIPSNDIDSARLITIVDSVSVGAYRGSPVLTGVNGFISAGTDGGEISVTTDDGFSMWYTTAFDHPMSFDSVHGTVAWRLAPEENRVSIFSNLVEFKGDVGEATGIVSVDVPWVGNSRPSNMDLFVGIRNSDAKHRVNLLPKKLDPNLKTWLDTSIKAGEVKSAGFIYRGRLSPGNNEITTQLSMDLEGGELVYHEDWPALHDINGRIELNSTIVSADIESAKVWDTKITDAQLLVETVDTQTMLTVRADINGLGNDGIQFLTQTPIRERVGSVFDEWQLSNQFQGKVDLEIPLTSGDQQGYQVVDLHLNDGDLHMTDLNLVFESLRGPLFFDSRTGLDSDGIDFRLWNNPVSAVVISNGYSDASAIENNQISSQAFTEILFSGVTQVADIQHWLNSPELLFAEGQTTFEGSLFIPAEKAADKPISLSVRSQLEGVAIDLPKPFNKLTATEMPFDFRLDINESENLYRIKLSDWLNGEFIGRENGVEQIDIAINEAARIERDGIYIHGLIPAFDLDEWLAILDRYEVYQNQVQTNSNVKEESELGVSFGLALYHSQIKSLHVPNIDLAGVQLTDQWSIEFNSDLAAGVFELPFSDAEAMTVRFEHLHLPVGEDKDPSFEEGDSLKDIDLSAIPLANVTIDALKLGEDDYGSWKFELIPEYNRLRVNNIIGNVRDLQISGRQSDVSDGNDSSGATLMWSAHDDQMSTHFSGKIESKKIDEALVVFAQPKVLEASDVKFDVDLSWPGSPAAIEITSLDGRIGVDMEHGRFIRAADGGGDAILRLVALFNFDSWARRLKLGVSDLVESGMAFDNIDGVLEFKNGDLLMTSPIRVKAPSSSLSYAGTIDLVNEELDTTLVATLPVGGNLTLIAALAGGLPAAAGVYVASKLFKKQVNKVASLSYKISGSWQKPKTEFIRLFDDNAAKKAGKKADEEASSISPTKSDPNVFIEGISLEHSYRLSELSTRNLH